MLAISWDQISKDTAALAQSIVESGYEYDLIVGAMRGGCIPACIISHALDIPMLTIGIKTYEGNMKTSNIDIYQSIISDLYNMRQAQSVERVLFVDDLSDTGETFNYLKTTYLSTFKLIHTAALYIKTETRHIPDFWVQEFAKNQWLEFPWESTLKISKYIHAV